MKNFILLIISLFCFLSCNTNSKKAIAKNEKTALNSSNSNDETSHIAITIDDLPGISLDNYQEVTDKLLTTLKKYKVPAIGFVNEGKLYPKNKLNQSRLNVLEDWLKAGMELGNHTYSHPDYNSISFEDYKSDIIKGEKHTKLLQKKYQQEMKYFRHPYLRVGNSIEKKEKLEAFLTKRGYKTAPVTIDNSEWIFAKAYHISLQAKNLEQMKKIGIAYVNYMEATTAYYEQQSQQLFGRPIKHVLLLHANALNGDYLDELLAMYKKRGYQFTSLNTILKDTTYQTKDTYTGKGGISWIHRWALTKKVDKSFFIGEPTCPEFVEQIAGFKD